LDKTKYNIKLEDSGFLIFIDETLKEINNEIKVPKKDKKV
jgi:hypothetical protein